MHLPLCLWHTHSQYFFGADILVAPVTQPVDNVTQMVEKEIWVPEVTCELAQANTQYYSSVLVFHSVHVLLPWHK